MLLKISLCSLLINIVLSQKANVCKNSVDYFYMDDNPNCWYNPDVNATLVIIIILFSNC